MFEQMGSRPVSANAGASAASQTATPSLAPLEVVVSTSGTTESSPLVRINTSSSSSSSPAATPPTQLSVAVGALTQQNAEWRALLDRIVAENFVEREGGKAIDEAGYDHLNCLTLTIPLASACRVLRKIRACLSACVPALLYGGEQLWPSGRQISTTAGMGIRRCRSRLCGMTHISKLAGPNVLPSHAYYLCLMIYCLCTADGGCPSCRKTKRTLIFIGD
jgi:hypothetical protein